MEENKTNEVVEKKWYQKTWIIATGLILTHIAAGYVIGANSGDESGENADTDSLDN